MKKFTATLFLMLFTVLSFTNFVFADDAAWAKHKTDKIPDWVLNGLGLLTISFVIFIIFFVMPPYVNKPLLDWWRKKKKGL